MTMSSVSESCEDCKKEEDALRLQDLRDRIAEDTLLMVSALCRSSRLDLGEIPHRSGQLVRKFRILTGRDPDTGEPG